MSGGGNVDGILKIKEEVDLPGNVSASDFSWSERDRTDGKR